MLSNVGSFCYQVSPEGQAAIDRLAWVYAHWVSARNINQARTVLAQQHIK